jgi:HSP20 family molecular chaperone IbpA
MEMTTLARRERPLFGELLDWLDTEFRTLPAVTTAAFGRGFRVEDYVEDGAYVVRAELPGVDPDKDVEVLVRDGLLTVRAERREETRASGRSEFHYGAFARVIALPDGADEESITATYADGILTVRVGLTGVEPAARRVSVTTPAAEGEPPATEAGTANGATA